jgi:hypothetical protein
MGWSICNSPSIKAAAWTINAVGCIRRTDLCCQGRSRKHPSAAQDQMGKKKFAPERADKTFIISSYINTSNGPSTICLFAVYKRLVFPMWDDLFWYALRSFAWPIFCYFALFGGCLL